MPVTWIYRGRMNSYQHFTVLDDWLFDLLEFKNIGRPIAVIDHCFHHTLHDWLCLWVRTD